MTLKEKINIDLTASMKAGEKIRTETLRSLRALILDFEKSGVDHEMNPDEEMKLLLSAAKKRKEAMDLFQTNNRPELAEKEKAEYEVIATYLPQQMTREEVEARVVEVIAEIKPAGIADINKVIPVLMKELKGKADGKLVQEIVKEKLASIS